jgi:hypothetical protein
VCGKTLKSIVTLIGDSVVSGGKMSAVKILRMERRSRVLELRKKGYSFRAIADEICQDSRFNQPRYSEKTARDDCGYVLKGLLENTRSEASQLRQLELERVNFAISNLAAQVEQGSLPAIDRWLKAIDLRSKLLGLHLENDPYNKAFSVLHSYGYEIRSTPKGFEMIDTYHVSD